MKKNTLIPITFLLFSILTIVSCSVEEENDGRLNIEATKISNKSEQIIKILKSLEKNDTTSYLAQIPTFDEIKNLVRKDTLINEEIKNELDSYPSDKWKRRVLRDYEYLIEKGKKFDIDWSNISFVKEKSMRYDTNKNGIREASHFLVFKDGSKNFVVRSDFRKINEETIFSDISTSSLQYFDKVMYCSDKNDTSYVDMRKNDNSEEDIMKLIVDNARVSFTPYGWYNLKTQNFEGYDEFYLSIDMQHKIEGNIDYPNFPIEYGSTKEFRISWDVLDEKGNILFNDSKTQNYYRAYLTFKYLPKNRSIDEKVTMIIKVNDRVVFSRMDSWRNFSAMKKEDLTLEY